MSLALGDIRGNWIQNPILRFAWLTSFEQGSGLTIGPGNALKGSGFVLIRYRTSPPFTDREMLRMAKFRYMPPMSIKRTLRDGLFSGLQKPDFKRDTMASWGLT